MGIPHLVTFLQPYATPILLSDFVHSGSSLARHGENSKRQSDQLHACEKLQHGPLEREETRDENANRPVEPRKQDAIVDGPALAYHAYHVALASRNNASNGLDAMPTYFEVNAIALNCLKVLEGHGFRIAAIFFDGVLPSSKQQIRIGRLQSYRKQLENFRAQNPSLGARTGASRRPVPNSQSSFSISHVPDKLKSLPALPFLVPSVIEALNQSQFQFQTRVVPAEADAYCAKHARLHGGVVFTSDSDLLIYDMGNNADVVLFRDIELSVSSSKAKTLRITKYAPVRIAKRLKLKSLLSFAYAVLRHHYRGFNACLIDAKKLEAKEADREYRDFIQQYSLADVGNAVVNPRLEAVLQRLDPRMSEWIHLSLDSKFKASNSEITQPETTKDDQKTKERESGKALPMYLPFLIDDPTRSTSWTSSSAIRILAYSLLLPASSTNEYTRCGTRIAPKPMEHLTPLQTLSTLQEWVTLLSKLRDETPDRVQLWRLIGVYSVCWHLLDLERPLPIRAKLCTLLSLRKDQPMELEWGIVHLEAQVQAVLFSWRMVWQCICIFEVVREQKSEEGDELYAIVGRMSELLADLPGIPLLLDAPFGSADEMKVENALGTLYRMLGVQDRGEEDRNPTEPSGSKKRKRKKDILQSKNIAAKNAKTPNSTNMFDLLAIDE